ncbi:ABC transporter permease [Candidatus Woesearchaeota archaeon]|nr:MAG: ABC transporter permease [Candidatus Woesearchaeota archaeon]
MRDYFAFAVSSIKHRQLRSWLTILGIVVGIAAIVALITVSQGLENAINAQFEQMGSNRLFIAPGGANLANFNMKGLTTKDYDVVKALPGVEWVSPYLNVQANAEFANKKAFVNNIFGIKPELMQKTWQDFDFELEDGTMFTGNEKYDVVIGYDVAHEFFDRDVKVGNLIKIKGVKFKVKGIVEQIGSPDDDQSITMPIETVRELFDKPDEISIIDLKAQEGVDINVLAARVERALERSRKDDDFEVLTPDQLLEQFGDVLKIVQIILGGIAAISLIVGGVGIMNSMYTNVLERTREIGIMKSIGATSKDIMWIFLFESGIMGAIGGLLGVLLGSMIAITVGKVAEQQGFQLLKIIIDYKLIIFAALFSFVVGALSGYLPAKQAAKLNPVDSLRYGQ